MLLLVGRSSTVRARARRHHALDTLGGRGYGGGIRVFSEVFGREIALTLLAQLRHERVVTLRVGLVAERLL